MLLRATRRLSATWCHGVAPDPVRLHAWVQTDNGVLAAEPSSTLAYTVARTINLRMVWLNVLAPNTAGIRAYEKAGFRAVGKLREAGYWLGKTCDEAIMDAVAGEFEGPSVVTSLLSS